MIPSGRTGHLGGVGPRVEAYSKPQKIAYGVRLVAQPAQKSETLPGFEAGHVQVIYEDGVYRAWRWGGGFQGQLFYTESADGFEWKKPKPVYRFSQMPGVKHVANLTVFKDPKGKSDERYKAMWCSAPTKEHEATLREQFNKTHPRYRNNVLAGPGAGMIGMYGAVSPDGIQLEDHTRACPGALQRRRHDRLLRPVVG